jgi:hypothetical protein
MRPVYEGKRMYTGKGAAYLASLDSILAFIHNPQLPLFPGQRDLAKEEMMAKLDRGERIVIIPYRHS